MWCARLLFSRSRVRGLLYTCSVRFGSSIVAVLGSFQVLWGTPVELHWGYNYYHNQFSYDYVDVLGCTDGEYFAPAGDTCPIKKKKPRVEALPQLERNKKSPKATLLESPTTTWEEPNTATREEPNRTLRVERSPHTPPLERSSLAHHI